MIPLRFISLLAAFLMCLISFAQNKLLLEAIEKVEIKTIDSLISAGTDVNGKNTVGYTALHAASKKGDLELVKLIVKAGAEIDAIHMNLGTPLMVASLYGNFNVVEFLAINGADMTLKDANGQSIVHNIVKKRILKFLIPYKINLNEKAEDKWSIVHTAATNGELQLMEYLIDSLNMNYLQGSSSGYTPFHAAIASSNLPIVNYFISKNIDINSPNEYGKTPLMYAVEEENIEIITLIINNGAKVDAQIELEGEILTAKDYTDNKEIKKLLQTR